MFVKNNETSKAVAAAPKGWNNKSDKKKKTKKKGPAPPTKPTTNTASNKQSPTPVVTKNPSKDSSGLYKIQNNFFRLLNFDLLFR